ncbi:hypothetical protein RJ641_004856 [Dillenia turbinata]|uniref:Uncharacterized protein n=1 Tax=Dillenia turbinata TaxID=194707 RepID=A0AAN8Z8A9_9MAGN
MDNSLGHYPWGKVTRNSKQDEQLLPEWLVCRASSCMNTVQYKGFYSDSRTKPKEDSPLEPFTSGWLPFLHRLLPHLI